MKNARGQVLPMVMIGLVILIIVIGSIVTWLQNDGRWTVKNQKTTSAINLAQGGVDRGTWKLQNTTTTWTTAAAGLPLAGYQFDTTYTDIPGGSYRIKFTSGPAINQVTIVAEGRDNANKEVRSVSAVYQNETIYSALMSGGNVTWGKGLGIFWGPIVSQGNIQMMDDVVGSLYFPRKFAKGIVIGTAANPRDTNGLTPPNTDNTEWWSEYSGVPNVPILDFVSLRSSAAATGTLNIYGCKNSSPTGTWDLRSSCTSIGSHNTHFGNSTHYIATHLNPNADYVWYWDGDLTLSGTFCGSSPCGESTALRGTVIVRGNLTIDTPGDFVYTGHVPASAWKEETKLTSTANDTATANEYPGDAGYHATNSTYNFGTDLSCIPLAGCGEFATVGIRGLTYVGGNLTILNYMDFHGALWVNGSVNASGGSNTTFCSIFYDDTLSVPALNVILVRQSWQEIGPSSTSWP